MKNLDVEKLERKNIYQLPENVFEKMQAKVLAETAPVKKAKIIKLNWIYSAAAALALLFGLTFYINNDPKEIPVNSSVAQTTPDVERNAVISTLSDDKVVSENDENSTNVEIPVNVEGINDKKEDVKTFAVGDQKSVKISKEVSTQKVQNAEIPMDQIIASFTTADLADLGRNTEQDVYLDLYN